MSANVVEPGWSFQFRYVAYTIVLYINFQEAFTRFGLPMTMVAGLVKKNCSDPLDTGTYCWSEDEKASAIGAFFYTYCLQIVVIWAVVASGLGFTAFVRIYLGISGVITFGMPWIAAISPYAVISAQAVRGVVACILIPHNYQFVRTWTIPSESGLYLTLVGSILIMGVYGGQMLAGIISSSISWEYFYYICGSLWGVLLVLHCVVIQTDVQQSRWLSIREKGLYSTIDKDKEDTKGRLSMAQIFRKLYLYAFCVFLFCHNYSFYMAATCFPFFLNEILHYDVDQTSFIMLGVGIMMAITNIAVSKIYPVVDRYIPWIRSRQIFTFTPLLLQAILYLTLPHTTSSPLLAVLVIVLLCMAVSTLYAGSVCTLNYEMDPVNSALVVSVFNSCGQFSGFFAPWFREKMTTTDVFEVDYYDVYRGRWHNFFYASSSQPVIAILAILIAMLVRPSEWVLSPLLVKEGKAEVYKETEESPNSPLL